MSEIKSLMELDYITVFLGVFAILFAAKEIIEIVSYFLKKLNIKTKADIQNEEYLKRLEKLETYVNSHYQKILVISEDLKKITETIKENEKKHNAETIATCRSTLYRLYIEAMQKGYVTQIELETFEDIANVYISAGGNHTMKDKIIPEFYFLPIKG